MIEEHDLQVVLQRWFVSAIDHLLSTEPPLKNQRRLTYDDFGNMHVSVGGGYEPDIWQWTEQQRGQLIGLPETDFFGTVVSTLLPEGFSDSNINQENLGKAEFFYVRFLCPLLRDHLYKDGPRHPDELLIAKMASDVADFVRNPVLLITPSVVVLENVHADDDFEIEDGVFFRATTLHEKRQMYFGEDPQFPDTARLQEVGERNYAPDFILHIPQSRFHDATTISETFTLACRLLGLVNVGYRYIEQKSDNPVRQSGYSRVGPLRGNPSGRATDELTRSHIESITTYWERFRNLYQDPNWHIAVSRYGQSFSRPRFDDQLVDLCVALESVFAAESRDGEISYRISLRASRLLGKDPESRYETFTRIKKAYSDRSLVVHGNAITKDKDWIRIIESLPYLQSILVLCHASYAG